MSVLTRAEFVFQGRQLGSSGDWLDLSGHNHHAQFPGGSNDPLRLIYDGFGYMHSDNGSGERMEVTSPPAAADIGTSDLATFAVWYRPQSNEVFQGGMATKESVSGSQLWSVGVSIRRPRIDIDDGTTDIILDWSGGAIAVDEWHYIVGTIDRVTDQMRLYVDGAEDSGGAVDISTVTGIATAQNISLGTRQVAGSQFDGDIASGEFYKDLATTAQILAAFNAGPPTKLIGLNNPVAIVQVGDVAPPFSSFVDPQNNTWTIFRLATGRKLTFVDRGMLLFGTDDFLSIPHNDRLNFASGEDFTVMLAGRSYDFSQGGEIPWLTKKNTPSVGAAGWSVSAFDFNDSLNMKVSDGTVQDSDEAFPIVGEAFVFAGVRNVSDDDVEAFLGGVSEGSPTTDTTTATLANTVPVIFGGFATPGGSVDGEIHGAAMWREKLTPSDIKVAGAELTGYQALHRRGRRMLIPA